VQWLDGIADRACRSGPMCAVCNECDYGRLDTSTALATRAEHLLDDTLAARNAC
jgi:hypothetical protein